MASQLLRLGLASAVVVGAGTTVLLTGAGGFLGRSGEAASPAAQARRTIAEISELNWPWSLSGDGKLAAVSNEYGDPAMFLVDLGAAGEAKRTRLELPDPHPCRPVLSPDGRWLLFQSCEFRSQNRELFLHELESGKTRTITPKGLPGSAQQFQPAWSPDSRAIAFIAFLGEGKPHQLHLVDAASGEDRVLHSADEKLSSPAWSPDGKRLALLGGASIKILDLATGALDVAYDVGETEPAPAWYFPDAPVWSPAGDRLAYGFMIGDCFRVHVVDPAAHTARELVPGECGMRPVWDPSGKQIVYLRLGGGERTLRIVSAEGGTPRPIGFDSGVTYVWAFDPAGSLLAMATPPHAPRALWRIDPTGAAPPRHVISASDKQPGPEWASLSQAHTVRSADGLEVPVRVFPRTCGDAAAPGPALLLIPFKHSDISPRWYQEIQYATAAGLTVAGVNFRGATGYGRAYKELGKDEPGQIEDVRAALRFLRSRPDVDPDQVYVLFISAAAGLSWKALALEHEQVRGIIDWVGAPIEWSDELLATRWPAMLWISAEDDAATPARLAAVKRLQAASQRVEHVIVPGHHTLQLAAGRARALAALHRFVVESSGYECEKQR